MRAWFIAPVACHALGSAGGGGGSAAGGGGGLSEGGGAGASPEDDEQPARSKIKTKIMRAPKQARGHRSPRGKRTIVRMLTTHAERVFDRT
jgi:hypothetical protein